MGHGFDPWPQKVPQASEAATTEARAPRAYVPWQEKPPQWDAWAPQQRVAPTCCNWRELKCSKEDPVQLKIKIKNNTHTKIHTRDFFKNLLFSKFSILI